MSNHEQNESASTQSLHAVLAEYIRRREAGEAVEMESLCAAYPELADGLRSYAEGEGLLEALSAPSRIDSGDPESAETIRPGASQRTDFAPQTEFGRYHLIRQLGSGAMGVVFLAEDTHLGRQVALKIPTGTGTEGPGFLKRFTREAQAAARLEHPNLSRIYDAGDVNGTPFISMEYINGPPLSQCVGVPEYQDQRRIAEIISAIASGLHCAHERGILHRDVKAGNVLMKNGTTPCVTDFGLARIDDRHDSKITHEGSILGTPAYMSPEQIRSELDQIGPHSDVYALGVILYELLAGHTPFQGSVLVILNQALNDQPQPLSKIRPDVDPQLADFCLRMLEKKPQYRPRSMQEVIDFLQQWLESTSPDSQAEKAKTEQERTKYEAMKSKALELIQRGQHAQAVASLEKMLNLTGPVAGEYADWARRTLPEVKKLPKQLQQRVPVLLATARQFIARHDYSQAAQLLQSIPPDFRGLEIQRTLDEALELQEESDLLLRSLQECVRTRQLQGIEENLERLLALKPGNKFAKDLWESLQTYRRLPYKQRHYQFNNKGHLQPLATESIWDSWLLWGTLCFLVVFGLAYSGITIYLKDGNRTLAVEVNEDWLRKQGGQLTLSVDGQEHTLSAADLVVKVTFGAHGFSVKSGDTVVHSPQTFSIEKGDTRVLHIDGSGIHLVPTGTSPSPSPNPVPVPEPEGSDSQLSGISLAVGSAFIGTYIQQAPVATHDIVVTLMQQQGRVWHGEFQSLQATDANSGGVTKTGFKFACEFEIDSLNTARLRMTAITGNGSGLAIRDTSPHWVEELTWDGKVLSNANMKLEPKPAVAVSKISRTTPLNNDPVDPFTGKQLQETWSKNFLGTTFLWIPPGRFRMGSVQETPDESDEWPVDVEIGYGFWVQQHELTQGEWRQLVGYTPWGPFNDKQINDRHAATHITWDEAVDYCQQLTDRDRRSGNIPTDWEYRLPTEAEWEYFCRAGTRSVYSFGTDVSELNMYAWWKENTQDLGEGYAHEVGKLLPNAWGLHDIHGNVFEYCYDSYSAQLPGGLNPVVADPPIAGKIGRGGGWAYVGADALECSERADFARNVRRNRVGVRLVLAPVSEISSAGYGRENMQPAATAGPQQVIAANSWYVVPEESTDDWRFTEGTLTGDASRGMSVAYLKEPCSDFELTMEVHCADPSNGGVFLRVPEPHATFQNVLEVHLGGGRDSFLPGTDHPSSGGLYLSDELQPPHEPGGDRDWVHSHDFGAETNAFRTGEWNRVKIRLVDQLLSVEINGQLAFWRLLDDLVIAFPHFANTVARRKGHIGLQAFVGTVQYRDIRIQPLQVD